MESIKEEIMYVCFRKTWHINQLNHHIQSNQTKWICHRDLGNHGLCVQQTKTYAICMLIILRPYMLGFRDSWCKQFNINTTWCHPYKYINLICIWRGLKDQLML